MINGKISISSGAEGQRRKESLPMAKRKSADGEAESLAAGETKDLAEHESIM